MSRAPSAAPTPMPACAPVDRPCEEVLAAGVEDSGGWTCWGPPAGGVVSVGGVVVGLLLLPVLLLMGVSVLLLLGVSVAVVVVDDDGEVVVVDDFVLVEDDIGVTTV